MEHIANSNGLFEVVVVGAACLDVKGRPLGDIVAGTSNPGVVQISVGGGARNVAENLARLGTSTALLSVVCQDDFGRTIIRQTERAGVNTDHVLISCDQHSAAYMALQSAERTLLVALADTVATGALTPEYIGDHASMLEQARMVVIDANVPLETAETLLSICGAAGVPVALEPVAYAPALQYRELAGAFYLTTPNGVEAQALTGLPVANTEQGALAAKQLVALGVQIAIITLGDAGLVYATPEANGYVPSIEGEIVDPTGAGDALTAAVVYALLNDIPVDEAVRLGVSAATLTLASTDTVRQDLSLESLYAQLVI
ncbi:MAG TPA: carbohydrate kinase family protein [Roseiflexaceae bacterium]|nr:carbohydrate kinase family protein [Roseiflexaceae bacterium]